MRATRKGLRTWGKVKEGTRDIEGSVKRRRETDNVRTTREGLRTWGEVKEGTRDIEGSAKRRRDD